MLHSLTERERQEVRTNLFPGAHYVVDTLPHSAWYRDRSMQITASRVQSSQALALDEFCTLDTLQSRDVVARTWAETLGLSDFGRVRFCTKVVLPCALLGERRSTQVDALIDGSSARALVECKLTEPDGGACSQTVLRRRSDGTQA